MRFDQAQVKTVLHAGEIIPSGGFRAQLKILLIAEEGIRIKSLQNKSGNYFTFSYLSDISDGFDKIDPRAIQRTMQPVLIAAKRRQHLSTENYAYGIVRILHEWLGHLSGSSGQMFTSSGEEALDSSSDQATTDHWEGSKTKVFVDRFERDSQAREACLAKHGRICVVCSFDFRIRYSEIGTGFIHVHHLRMLSEGGRRVDPILDLVPVCPNCHAMLHRKNPPYTPGELRDLIR
ncbi:HNH endonuclease [Tunturiibacter gelidoferens]|uniref:HNH endonuclease n=1 Tax=Tunturiibacter gelidiferens TaxID=3069689 RepID=A0AAU7YWZ2_9BACT